MLLADERKIRKIEQDCCLLNYLRDFSDKTKIAFKFELQIALGTNY